MPWVKALQSCLSSLFCSFASINEMLREHPNVSEFCRERFLKYSAIFGCVSLIAFQIEAFQMARLQCLNPRQQHNEKIDHVHYDPGNGHESSFFRVALSW